MSRYSNDEWTLVDTLGYEPFIQQLLGLIEKAQPPFSIGIYGGWGTGKTSIMRQLFFRTGGKVSSVLLPLSEDPVEEHLDPETLKKIKAFSEKKTEMRAVWFNPWQHQFDNDPIIGLLHEIRDNFDLSTQVGDEARKLAHVTVRGGLDILSSVINKLTKVKADPGKFEKYGEKYEAEHFAVKSSSQRFRLLFEKAIDKLLGEEHKALVVYIDDLDRCTDTNTIKLIEGIKLYLSTSNCIFVFGMDQVNVLRALENHQIHKDYLDKLFQSIIRIPLSKNYPALIREIVDSYFPDADTKRLTRLLADILEKNPRKVKNFLNSFRSYWELLNLSAEDGTDQVPLRIKTAALFHYLRIYCEPVFTVLERHPDCLDALKSLKNVCKNEAVENNIEKLFNEFLRNPISSQSHFVSDDETAELVSAGRLEKEEFEYMKDISSRYEALEQFKKYFAELFHGEIAVYDQETLNRYLGVIDHAE